MQVNRRRPYEHEDGDQGDASTSQGMPKIARRKLEALEAGREAPEAGGEAQRFLLPGPLKESTVWALMQISRLK